MSAVEVQTAVQAGFPRSLGRGLEGLKVQAHSGYTGARIGAERSMLRVEEAKVTAAGELPEHLRGRHAERAVRGWKFRGLRNAHGAVVERTPGGAIDFHQSTPGSRPSPHLLSTQQVADERNRPR